MSEWFGVKVQGRRAGVRRSGGNDVRELVREFLMAVRDRPAQEVAEIAGLNPLTIERWRRTGTRKIEGATKQRLLAYLDHPDRHASPARS